MAKKNCEGGRRSRLTFLLRTAKVLLTFPHVIQKYTKFANFKADSHDGTCRTGLSFWRMERNVNSTISVHALQAEYKVLHLHTIYSIRYASMTIPRDMSHRVSQPLQDYIFNSVQHFVTKFHNFTKL